MTPLLILVALSGCSSGRAPASGSPELLPPEPPATPTPITLDQAAGSIPWRLLDHVAEGTYTFPPGDPAAAEDAGHFVLSGPWKAKPGKKGHRTVYSRDLPFSTPMPRPNYAPFGARFVHDGKDVAYTTTFALPSGRPDAAWFVDHGKIKLFSVDDPNQWAAPAELVVEELSAELRKRQFASAGLPPDQFAQNVHEAGGVTRPGLYLPAPASAEFPVPVPAKGKLHFGLGLLDDPITGKPNGDGVDVTVTLDGAEVWHGHVSATEPAPDVAVDLPAGAAARTGKLRFASAPGATDRGDFLVVTAPFISDSAVRTPRHVVVVGVDTLRWDALSANGAARDTSPELDAWLAQSVQFTRAYSAAPRTKPSFRTAFTGRFPPHSDGAPTIAQVIGPLGFTTAGVVGNIHLVPRAGFNAGMDSWEYQNGAKASEQVDRALAWAKAHADEDTYLFVHFMDPHTFYEAPPPWQGRYQDGKPRPKGIPAKFNRWPIYNLMQKGRLTDAGKAWIHAAYDEEVAYTAHEVSRLFRGVDALPGQTLEVIHADHGEEFWDHGAYEHNHTLYNELVHVELAIRPPGGLAGKPKVDTPVGLVDLAPTIFDFLGVPAAKRPVLDGVSLRPFVDAARAADAPALAARLVERPLLIGSLRYGRDRWAVLLGNDKYIVHTASGQEQLFDVVADPTEQHDLIGEATPERLQRLRAGLAAASGWTVLPGYRFTVPVNPGVTVVTFDAPVQSVQVLDPELGEEFRANLDWGETPRRSIPDVGAVELAEDRRSFVFTPGPKAVDGVVVVQCAAEPCPAGTLRMGAVNETFPSALQPAPGEFGIRPGPVFLPTDPTDLTQDGGEASSDEIEQLNSLGYIHDDGEADK